jgi:hypothetical protein
MKTSKTSKTILAALLGAATVVAGCASTSDDDVDSSDQAQTQKAPDDEDDFTVEDRMGRPEMTNVTLGAGLVRLKVAKAKLGDAQGRAAAEPDPASKAALVAQAQALGAELKRLATELGAPEAEELKSALAKDAQTTAVEAKAVEDAKREGKPAPSFPRRTSGYFHAYNHQNTFHPKAGERADAKRLLAAGIRALDTLVLDGSTPDRQDWSEAEIQTVAEILSEDALIVDLEGDCTQDTQSYFSLEREAIQSATARAKNVASCGGRTLNDDIIDDTLTMWVTKSFDLGASNPRRVSDNVVAVKAAGSAGPYTLSPSIPKFPYLGEPRSAPFIGAGSCSIICRTPPPAASSSATTPTADEK